MPEAEKYLKVALFSSWKFFVESDNKKKMESYLTFMSEYI